MKNPDKSRDVCEWMSARSIQTITKSLKCMWGIVVSAGDGIMGGWRPREVEVAEE